VSLSSIHLELDRCKPMGGGKERKEEVSSKEAKASVHSSLFPEV